MMISLIAGAMIFVAMSYVGMIVKNQYKLRYRFLQDIEHFAKFTLREVTHYKTPINTIIDKYIIANDSSIKPMLLSYREQCARKEYENIYGIINYIYLKKEDRQLMIDFFMNLGRRNYEEEIKYIQAFTLDVGNLRESAHKALNKEGRLYFQLLSLVGLALMIIVV